MLASSKAAPVITDDARLLEEQATYSSFGDTVHYVDPPKIFHRCQGSFLYSRKETDTPLALLTKAKRP